MNLLDRILFKLGFEPKNANQFISKFMLVSKSKRFQLEMISGNKILLQVDALKFVNSWFDLLKIDKKLYKNGYVIFFVLKKDNIEQNPSYVKLINSGLDLYRIDENLFDEKVVTFCDCLPSTSTNLVLANRMREIINSVYFFEEENPQILFNIREILIEG